MVDRPSKPLPRALGNSFPQLHWGMSSSRVVLARQSKRIKRGVRLRER